jgi:uncharacterized protein (UPF0261 family)
MRTTAEENAAIGQFIARKLNAMKGPVRFLLPLGGVSALDIQGGVFWSPEANQALFSAIERDFRPSADHKLIKRAEHINDPAFAQALVDAWHEIAPSRPARAMGAASSDSRRALV